MDGAFSLLFVDDDIVLQDLVKYSLKRDPNIHLEYSSSGAAALERLSQPGIDVVLSDVMMPHMSGPDLLAAMRRNPNLARVPVIFITASTLSVPEAQLVELGACGVIGKPFDPNTLAERIRELLQDHRID